MSNGSQEISTTENHSDNETREKDVAKKREELLRLSEDGEIPQSVANLKKASGRVVLKIYEEYEMKQAEKANALTDLLGGLEAIESSEALEKELSKDKLLRRDVKFLVEKVTPYLPYLGLLSGGITVGKHVKKKYNNQEEKKEE